jgi:hypothetical protein
MNLEDLTARIQRFDALARFLGAGWLFLDRYRLLLASIS